MLAIRRPNASLQVALAPERQRLFEVQGVAKLAYNLGLSQSDINSSMSVALIGARRFPSCQWLITLKTQNPKLKTPKKKQTQNPKPQTPKPPNNPKLQNSQNPLGAPNPTTSRKAQGESFYPSLPSPAPSWSSWSPSPLEPSRGN